jgi:hypothetical protein
MARRSKREHVSRTHRKHNGQLATDICVVFQNTQRFPRFARHSTCVRHFDRGARQSSPCSVQRARARHASNRERETSATLRNADKEGSRGCVSQMGKMEYIYTMG